MRMQEFRAFTNTSVCFLLSIGISLASDIAQRC